jgi:lactoylglutathione lyase
MPSITRTPTLAPTVPYNRASRWHLVSADRGQPTGTTVSSDPCPTVAQIELIALATDDVESLRDFYLQLGGVASPLSTDPDSGLRSCVLDFCGVRLEVFERQGSGEGMAGGERSPGLMHLGFALESANAVDELSSVIAAAGHRVLEPPHRAGELGRYESVVLDPDGNRLKLTV